MNSNKPQDRLHGHEVGWSKTSLYSAAAPGRVSDLHHHRPHRVRSRAEHPDFRSSSDGHGENKEQSAVSSSRWGRRKRRSAGVHRARACADRCNRDGDRPCAWLRNFVDGGHYHPIALSAEVIIPLTTLRAAARRWTHRAFGVHRASRLWQSDLSLVVSGRGFCQPRRYGMSKTQPARDCLGRIGS